MTYKEIDGCSQCPLMEEGICPGGWKASPEGEPVEPPCCSFEDDTDIEEWIKDYYAARKQHEEYMGRKYKEGLLKKQKLEAAKKKQRYMINYCFKERQAVETARKRLKLHKEAVSEGRSLAYAFNVTNEMFGYPERMRQNPETDNELKKLEYELDRAEKVLKEKQKEAKNTEGYRNIK